MCRDNFANTLFASRTVDDNRNQRSERVSSVVVTILFIGGVTTNGLRYWRVKTIHRQRRTEKIRQTGDYAHRLKPTSSFVIWESLSTDVPIRRCHRTASGSFAVPTGFKGETFLRSVCLGPQRASGTHHFQAGTGRALWNIRKMYCLYFVDTERAQFGLIWPVIKQWLYVFKACIKHTILQMGFLIRVNRYFRWN